VRVLALCNPTSGGRPERLDALHQFGLAISDQRVQMEVEATRNADDAVLALSRADLGGEDVLLISGGDGTIQHALSWLLHGYGGQEPQPAETLPIVALLPAGSTNMTALDINPTRGWDQSLEAFLGRIERVDRVRDLPAVRQRLVSVVDGDITRAGFFFGAGAIVRGIEYCNDVLFAGGAARRERTAGLAMARTIWGVLRKQPPFHEIDLLAAHAITTDGELPAFTPESGALLLACSTLDRLLLGVRPFWGEPESEPLRYVLAERDAKLIRGLPGLLGVPGFPRPVASRGFHSHNCTRLRLTMDSAYAIDGELFTPTTGELELSVDRTLRFLTL